jgi:molybdopterin synthase sulfur carrier subunit
MNTKQTIKLELEFFAILKDIITDNYSFNFENPISIKELKEYLIDQFPNAKEILTYSRFSTEEKILSEDIILEKNQKIFVLPPSSGG